MKLAFVLGLKNTLKDKKTGVWGEEIIANACMKIFKSTGIDAEIIGISDIEKIDNQYDVALYMFYNMVCPYKFKQIAKKNILWIQGFNYGENGNIIPLDKLYEGMKVYYDLVISASKTLADKYDIPFVIPPIDFDLYSKVDIDYMHDITFIGNLIKPFATNEKYINPMCRFNYGLYGGDFGKIPHEKWLEVVSGTRVNLHYGFKEGIEWDMVTGGPFFIAACKGFMLSDKIPWYMEKFKDAFVFTDGGEDEVGKIQYYLDNDTERKKKALRAYEIVKELDFSILSEIVKGV